jgi:N-acylneuraminate cytidylyltransferase
MAAEVLALVPARGGSKGIPRKNLLELAGKPLIAHSIELALASRRISRVVVSTDDAQIADTARRYGADVPFLRPADYAQDLSPDLDVFRHALGWLRDHEGYACELVVHLRPSAPARRVEIIDRAIDLMLEHPEADSLRSVSLARQTPYKMWRIVDGALQPLLALDGVREPYCQPRQTLPVVYWQNGYVDIVRPRVVLEQGMMCGRRTLPLLIQEPIVELDYEEQIPEAEAAIRRLRQEPARDHEPAAIRHPA